MPQYYNPGLFPAIYPQVGYSGGNVYQQPSQMTYMYQVDGENAARAWQAPGGVQLPPNTIVPLFDVDGEHIYFKSTDMYGRMNPVRKGKVVIESDPVPMLPNGQSGSVPQTSTSGQFVTKEDLESMEQRIMAAINQNGRKNVQQSPQQNNGNPRGEMK